MRASRASEQQNPAHRSPTKLPMTENPARRCSSAIMLGTDHLASRSSYRLSVVRPHLRIPSVIRKDECSSIAICSGRSASCRLSRSSRKRSSSQPSHWFGFGLGLGLGG